MKEGKRGHGMSRYIDADALVKRLKHSPLFLGTNMQFKDGVINLVEKQPTADVVEVRNGEWKDRHENKYANHYYECSVCGNPALDRTVNNGLGNPMQKQALSPYCPECGAKMDGERREE